MRINNNIAALNTYRQLGSNNVSISKSLEKLSSGSRINRAGDDAAGLAISERMRSQIRGLDQASRNAQDGISLIQTAEGALGETQAILQRTRELIIQATNGTNTDDDKTAIQEEIGQLKTEITAIANRTEFNTTRLLDGTAGVGVDDTGTYSAELVTLGATITHSGLESSSKVSITFSDTYIQAKYTANGTIQIQQISIGTGNTSSAIAAGKVFDFEDIGLKLEFSSALNLDDISTAWSGAAGQITTNDNTSLAIQLGANAGQSLNIEIDDMRATALGADTVAGKSANDIDVTDFTTISETNQLEIVDEAISDVSTLRGKLGAYQNRLEHTNKSTQATHENLKAAESRVRDVDMAKEMMNFTKDNILMQAAQSMLAQANQLPQGVLQLLR